MVDFIVAVVLILATFAAVHLLWWWVTGTPVPPMFWNWDDPDHNDGSDG